MHIEIKENPTLKDAVEACILWFDAEDKNLGTLYQRMDLCAYSDWACRKAIGQEVKPFKGVPRLVIERKTP